MMNSNIVTDQSDTEEEEVISSINQTDSEHNSIYDNENDNDDTDESNNEEHEDDDVDDEEIRRNGVNEETDEESNGESDEDDESMYLCKGCLLYGRYGEICYDCLAEAEGYIGGFTFKKLTKSQCDHLDEVRNGENVEEQGWFKEMIRESMAEDGQVYN